MRSIVFVLLLIASFWVLFLGLRERPAPIVVPDDHIHTPAPTGAAAQTGSATETASVRLDDTLPGYAVYRANGCATCHGADALGSRMGPSLAEAHLNYDRDSLTRYLRDPEKAIADDPRLLQMQSRYPRIQMPPVKDLASTDMDALVTFILEPTAR